MADLFTFADEGQAGPANGTATFRADLSLAAPAIERAGVSLGGEFTLEGAIGGTVGTAFAKAFAAAGIDVRVAALARAALPVDIFDEAGLVARARLSAGASAWVRAGIELDQTVVGREAAAALPAPWRDLGGIIADPGLITLRLGVFGNVAFAAQVFAEAAFAGSLNGGFSWVCSHGAGFGVAGGWRGVVDLGIGSPARLTDAVGRVLVAGIGDRLDARDRQLLGAVLPAALRIALELGEELAGAADDWSETAVTRVSRALGGEMQRAASTAVMRSAGARAATLMSSREMRQAVEARPDQGEAARKLREAVTAARGLAALDVRDADRLGRTAGDAVTVVAAAMRDVPVQLRAPVDEGLATAWAAATIAEWAFRWAERADGAAVPQEVAPPPEAQAVMQPVLGRPVTTVADAGEYLAARFAAELAAAPAGDPVLDVARRVMMAGAQPLTYQALRAAADGELSAADARALVARAALAISEAGVVPLGPALDALARQPGWGPAAAEFARPSLRALTEIILPELAKGGASHDAAAAKHLRELCSVVVLLALGRPLLATGSAALADGLPPVSRDLREFAQTIEDEPAAPIVSTLITFFAVLGGVALVFIPGRRDAAGVLRLSADMIDRWNDRHREAWFGAARDALTLHVAGVQRDMPGIWDDLADPSVPVGGPDTIGEIVTETLIPSAGDLALFAAPRVAELLALHMINPGRDLVDGVAAGVRVALEGLEQAAVWAGQRLEDLDREIRRILDEIGELVRSALAEVDRLAERLVGAVGGAVTAVRDAGWAWFEALLGDLAPGAPIDLARGAWNAAFGAVADLVRAPLTAIGDVARWLHEILEAERLRGSISAETVRADLRALILGAFARDVVVEGAIPVPLFPDVPFRVTIPFGTVGAAVVDWVLGLDAFTNALDTLIGWYAAIVGRQAHVAGLTALRSAGEAEAAEAVAALQAVVSGARPVVAVTAPALDGDGTPSLTAGAVPLTVEVTGITAAHLAHTAGVPRRVRLLVNGIDYPYDPRQWRLRPDGTWIFTAMLVPTDADPSWWPRPVTFVRPGAGTLLRDARLLLAPGASATAAVPEEAQRAVIRGDPDGMDIAPALPPALLRPDRPLPPRRRTLPGRTVRGRATVDVAGIRLAAPVNRLSSAIPTQVDAAIRSVTPPGEEQSPTLRIEAEALAASLQNPLAGLLAPEAIGQVVAARPQIEVPVGLVQVAVVACDSADRVSVPAGTMFYARTA